MRACKIPPNMLQDLRCKLAAIIIDWDSCFICSCMHVVPAGGFTIAATYPRPSSQCCLCFGQCSTVLLCLELSCCSILRSSTQHSRQASRVGRGHLSTNWKAQESSIPAYPQEPYNIPRCMCRFMSVEQHGCRYWCRCAGGVTIICEYLYP